MRLLGWALVQPDCPCKKRKKMPEACMCIQGWPYEDKAARGWLSESQAERPWNENNPASILVLDF